MGRQKRAQHGQTRHPVGARNDTRLAQQSIRMPHQWIGAGAQRFVWPHLMLNGTRAAHIRADSLRSGPSKSIPDANNERVGASRKVSADGSRERPAFLGGERG